MKDAIKKTLKNNTMQATKKWFAVLMLLVVAIVIVAAGCMDRPPAPMCPVPTEVRTVEHQVTGFDGVDMLVVVDNSISMEKEQEILATSFFTLINSLVNPPEASNWQYDAVNNMRLAVVTTDMAFSAGGEEYDHDDAEVQWPHPISGLANCWDSKMGDGAKFMGYDNSAQVTIESGEIVCDDEEQCPEDWSCAGNLCVSPSGSAEAVDFPGLGKIFAETTADDPSDDLSIQAACLGTQGTLGCGIEQQLQAGAFAFHDDNESQRSEFIKQSHLLAYLFVSDEEDCSLKDEDARNDFFKSADIENSKRINVACGDQAKDWLLSASELRDLYIEPKETEGAVIFAAIVGVPTIDECQADGANLGDCLEQDEMQYVETEDEGNFKFEFACERGEATQATPGRRFVEVAREFDTMSYVYSICNADWSPAMEQIAELIAKNLGGTCFEKHLGWDAATQTAKCNVVVSIEGADSCPDKYEEGGEVITLADGSTQARCVLPKLPTPLDCALSEVEADEFGWFYCENLGKEDFATVCNDGIDNDGQGGIDCDDSSCDVCCTDGEFDPTLPSCEDKCAYMVNLTAVSQDATKGKKIEVECMSEFTFEDKNCSENTYDVCNDDLDNDGNGSWDCVTVDIADAEEGDTPHLADGNCCPMVKEGNDCVINQPLLEQVCDGFDFGGGALPAACEVRASQLGCAMPDKK